ncbi:MAG: DUF2779 domain-containing protein [Candidatus Poseidoniales archaeon]
MSSTRYLTKSRFKLAMECPTKLFYTRKPKEYKNNKGDNEFLASLAEGGFQVGKMATLLFPDGKEIKAKRNEEALAETAALLSSNESIILFEPALAFENLLVRVDVLVKQGNLIELIEVKAKSYNSEDPDIEGVRTDINASMLPYIEDAAFQKYVVSNALPSCSVSTFLMMPDKSVAAVTDGLNQCFRIESKNEFKEARATRDARTQVEANKSLLAKVPIDKYVDIVMSKPLEYPGSDINTQNHLPERAAIWAELYRDDIRIGPNIHKGCKNCEFRADQKESFKSGYHECLAEFTGLSREEIDQGTVLDIWRYTKKEDLIAKKIFKIEDATEQIIVKHSKDGGLSYTERQCLQIDGIPSGKDKGGFYFDSVYFNERRSNWSYPYHMIDFETSTVALPFFAGMHPYESIAFQFSHHVMHENGHVEHLNQTLLTEQGVFPNFEFVRQLKKSLDGDSGTIFRWAAHENTILNHIKNQLTTSPRAPDDKDELIQFIESITNQAERSMVDLNEMALKCYFHPSTQGRTSIKKVLPAVLQSSEILKSEYSKPIGPHPASLNFPEDFIWYQLKDSQLVDPYDLLKQHAEKLFQEINPTISQENRLIADGGAAAMAYARLQFENLPDDERQRINMSLLRYCELDTLAMVMIMKAWIEWS